MIFQWIANGSLARLFIQESLTRFRTRTVNCSRFPHPHTQAYFIPVSVTPRMARIASTPCWNLPSNNPDFGVSLILIIVSLSAQTNWIRDHPRRPNWPSCDTRRSSGIGTSRVRRDRLVRWCISLDCCRSTPRSQLGSPSRVKGNYDCRIWPSNQPVERERERGSLHQDFSCRYVALCKEFWLKGVLSFLFFFNYPFATN